MTKVRNGEDSRRRMDPERYSFKEASKLFDCAVRWRRFGLLQMSAAMFRCTMHAWSMACIFD